jgi:hypothetical protein
MFFKPMGGLAMKDQMYAKLKAVALQKTTPFCYSCYKEAPSGRCQLCESDDLMRYFGGVGVRIIRD